MLNATLPIRREMLLFPPMADRKQRPGSATGESDQAGLNEADLVRGIVNNHTDTVAEFLRRTHEPVYRIASRLTSDPDSRADWAHETLLGILEDVRNGRFEYRGPGSFWGWFRKRAYYRVLDQYRKNKLSMERERPSGAGPSFPEFAGVAGALDPHEELERVRLRSALEACLARIVNAKHRQALECLLFRDMAYEPIAKEMDAPLNTVRAWIRRGRLVLRKCLVHSLDLLDSTAAAAPPTPEGEQS